MIYPLHINKLLTPGFKTWFGKNSYFELEHNLMLDMYILCLDIELEENLRFKQYINIWDEIQVSVLEQVQTFIEYLYKDKELYNNQPRIS